MRPTAEDRKRTGPFSMEADRLYGKYRGTVKDLEDPKNLGRLRARVPEVLGEELSNWALPCAPYAGNGVGMFAVPPLDAGVWIEFEAGDVSRPIWTGCWWGSDQPPKDEQGTAATPPLKIIRSEKGLMILLDDSSQTIILSDENGGNMVSIQVRQGRINIQGGAKVVVEAPQIELVENGAHPVVFGDQLLQYLNQFVAAFNMHTHPGELALAVFPITPAPPVPAPFPPATPALLSKKVTAG